MRKLTSLGERRNANQFFLNHLALELSALCTVLWPPITLHALGCELYMIFGFLNITLQVN